MLLCPGLLPGQKGKPTLQHHVMTDLETLSLRADAAILSIGACTFSSDPDSLPRMCFAANVDLQSCVDAGLHVDMKTVA